MSLPFVQGATVSQSEVVLGSYESDAAAEAYSKIHAFVRTVETGTYVDDLNTNNLSTTELPTAASGIRHIDTGLSVDIASGDQVILETGSRFDNTTSTSYVTYIRGGGTGATDLVEGGSATTNAGWMELTLGGSAVTTSKTYSINSVIRKYEEYYTYGGGGSLPVTNSPLPNPFNSAQYNIVEMWDAEGDPYYVQTVSVNNIYLLNS